MSRPISFPAVATLAWLACALQAAVGIPEGVTFCPVRLLTGHRCPGCGMGHAVVYAMRGDFTASLHWHPLGLPLLAVWTCWLALVHARVFRVAQARHATQERDVGATLFRRHA